MRRKYAQIKAYSKIMKNKWGKEENREVTFKANQQQKQQEGGMQDEAVDMPKNQQFEDPFEDQFEEEEGWISQSDDEQVNESGTMISQKAQNKNIETQQNIPKKSEVFLGTNKNLNRGQVLQFDNRAYDMLHRLNVEWPSMSIDFVCKGSPFETLNTGFEQMKNYPYEVLTVQGSCNGSNKNSIYLTKWIKLHQTKYDDDPEGENENEDDDDPQIITQQIETSFDVNRIKSLNNSPIVAFWSDNGKSGQIHIVDLTSNYEKLRNNVGTKKKDKCKQIIIPCETSGFALNWNPHKIGQLLVGDNEGTIRIYNNNQNYTEWTETSKYNYHKGSVEDVIFSPQQPFVFASCSSDKTLQIVDMRAQSYKKSQLKINAHDKDVNVCDWNKRATNLIVTGSDDCTVKVWDLRMLKNNQKDQLLCFNWHTQPITSIKFQPNEQSVIAVSSEDNRLTIWDMSVQNEDTDPEIPNELMFLHQGQQEIKQIVYHPIYYEMLISTSLDSINIFKPAFEMPEFDEDELADREDLKKPPIKEEDLDKYIQRMSLN